MQKSTAKKNASAPIKKKGAAEGEVIANELIERKRKKAEPAKTASKKKDDTTTNDEKQKKVKKDQQPSAAISVSQQVVDATSSKKKSKEATKEQADGKNKNNKRTTKASEEPSSPNKKQRAVAAATADSNEGKKNKKKGNTKNTNNPSSNGSITTDENGSVSSMATDELEDTGNKAIFALQTQVLGKIAEKKTVKGQDKTEEKKGKEDDEEEVKRGVLYLGRIPHGFYEEEMKGFFSQFGKVTRLRLSRNKKTLKSKHFAFIEFADEEVAKVVAEAMHGQFVLGNLLQCHVIPEDKVHLGMFTKKKLVKPDHAAQVADRNQPKTAEVAAKRLKRLVSREQKNVEKLKELGVNYEFKGYKQDIQTPKHTVF